MTVPLSAYPPQNGYNPNLPQQTLVTSVGGLGAVPLSSSPLGARRLSDSEIKKDKHFQFVANPPVIQRYSFYNELKLDKDNFMEYLSTTRKTSPELKKSKAKKKFNTFVKIAISAGLAVLAYKNRAGLKNFCVNAYNKVSQLFKK